MERPAVEARGDLPLGAVGGVERALAHHGDDGVVAGAEPRQPIEDGLGQCYRRELARPDEPGELADGKEDGAGGHASGGGVGRSGASALPRGTARKSRASSTIPATSCRIASSSSAPRRLP